MISKGTRLKSIKIGPNNCSTLDPELMATSVHNMEEVEMRGTRITQHQIIDILTRKENSCLKFLDIRGNWAVKNVPKIIIEDAKKRINQVLTF